MQQCLLRWAFVLLIVNVFKKAAHYHIYAYSNFKWQQSNEIEVQHVLFSPYILLSAGVLSIEQAEPNGRQSLNFRPVPYYFITSGDLQYRTWSVELLLWYSLNHLWSLTAVVWWVRQYLSLRLYLLLKDKCLNPLHISFRDWRRDD